ncbi:MAG TPA: monovalent cation/H+ antiporter subunit D family protein [Thiotrichaceae bacterium]|nr:monovalent cation/H+ antiporter subunit D family protein [Thiotrichaceae bacterium]HIM07832.1 monovalent cation/H+ antiporter subunit D family protein [Gammaproteobacteria bacterium]
MNSHLPVLQVLLPLIAAPLCVILRQSVLSWLFATLICFLSFIISCVLFNQVLESGVISYALGGWLSPWGIEYRLDKLTAFMLLIINGVAAIVLLGARESIADEISSDRLYLFYTAFLLNLTGVLGVIMTGDAFNLFVFIEIASLSSYAMISIGNDRRCLYAAFKYLIFGTIGASFILISVGLLYAVTGTLNMVDIFQRLPDVENTKTLTTALVFFVVGIGIKAAIFPLHLWLPDAYSYSPSIVSTFLAGTTTKVFVYVLIRFIYSVFGYETVFVQEAMSHVLMILACAGILYGSYLAIQQDSLKRLLAYSSVAQLGYMLLGISLATEAGLAAGLIHVFNHAIIKVALFLSVIIIIFYTKTDSISKLAGLAKTMPLLMLSFLIGGLSLIGVPLTAGFVSKWFLIKASFENGYWGLVVVIVFSSVLAIIYIWKFIEVAYFKEPDKVVIAIDGNQKTPYLLLFSLFVFVIANVYFGLDSSLNVDMANAIAQDFYLDFVVQ